MPEASEEETKRAVIERFYEEVWNEWNLAADDEIVSEDADARLLRVPSALTAASTPPRTHRSRLGHHCGA